MASSGPCTLVRSIRYYQVLYPSVMRAEWATVDYIIALLQVEQVRQD